MYKENGYLGNSARDEFPLREQDCPEPLGCLWGPHAGLGHCQDILSHGDREGPWGHVGLARPSGLWASPFWGAELLWQGLDRSRVPPQGQVSPQALLVLWHISHAITPAGLAVVAPDRSVSLQGQSGPTTS